MPQELQKIKYKFQEMHIKCKSFVIHHSWINWLFVYLLGLLYFFIYRLKSIPILMKNFISEEDNNMKNKIAGIFLGILEDMLLLSYLVGFLYLVDRVFIPTKDSTSSSSTTSTARATQAGVPTVQSDLEIQQQAFVEKRSKIINLIKKIFLKLGRFVFYTVFFLLIVLPFAADSILVRLRTMRFTFQYITMYFKEKDAISNLQVSEREIQILKRTLTTTILLTFGFSIVCLSWLQMNTWSPIKVLERLIQKKKTRRFDSTSSYRPTNRWSSDAAQLSPLSDEVEVFEMKDQNVLSYQEFDVESPKTNTPTKSSSRTTTTIKPKSSRSKRALQVFRIIAPVVLLIVFTFVVYGITQATSPTIAMVALNTSLNEYFKFFFGEKIVFTPSIASANFDVDMFINKETEEYQTFGSETVYRLTTGFKGPLEFDVKIEKDEKPNVLLLVVESFRYHDSQYLVQNNTYLLNETNITVTPQFDKWAKKGIAFRNLWSSWRTSRALESLLFGQVPIDSVTETGTTGGRVDVELSGLPQLFKKKGYETVFTSGCRTDYDDWNIFLPSHGFDEIINSTEMTRMGTEELKIDWEVGHRNHSYWGPHDDVSFELLGRILKKRKKAQEEAGKDKRKPWFFNHFTITSHVPFWERPDWYKDYKEIPDFSVLYENRSYSDDIKRYLELRYFQDMELGKFMDQMEEAGVLNDTIVFIVGDHGQAPEYGVDAAANRKVSAQRVAGALIAQGRLGDAAGTIFDDVASHMDVLNTMADIVGLPPGGFIQSGVGRSLKRKLPFGQHVVWSNSPETKLSAIQGHTRIEYDREFNKMNIYDVDLDHEQSKDLYPEQIKNQTRKEEITRIFQAGRYISKYFTDRYKKKCILKTSC